MAMIEITVEDDVEGEKEYTIAFVTTYPVTEREGAMFEIQLIWDAAGSRVTGGEFDAVAEVALDCYYDEMLEVAEER